MTNAMRLLLLGTACALGACNGQVTIGVTDAPIDEAESVVIQFEGVDLIGNDGTERYDINPPLQVDLLQLQGLDREILMDRAVPEGDYTAVRLRISADGSGADSYIETAAGRFALELEQTSSLRISRSFSVGIGDDQDFTIDFDLRRSIREPENNNEPYRLVPVLRIVNAASAGSIAGVIDGDRLGSNCMPAVYAFEGSERTPDDVGSSAGPVNTGLGFEAAGGDREYAIGTLRAGDYTLALTCEAGEDDPETNDDIEFLEQVNVTVERGETTIADF